MEEQSNEALRALCRKLLEDNPYCNYNHMTLGEVKKDEVELYTELTKELTNIYGMAHGGMMCALADTCAGLTVRMDGNRHVTLDINIRYYANVKSGRITARSRVVKRGKTVNVMNVKVSAEDETVLAEATVSFFRIG